MNAVWDRTTKVVDDIAAASINAHEPPQRKRRPPARVSVEADGYDESNMD